VAIVFNIVIPIVAGGAFLLFALLLVRALQKRTTSHSPFAYGVARQETRHSMQADLLRAAGVLLLAMILVVIYLLGQPLSETAAVVEETPPAALPTLDVVEQEPVPTAVNTATPTPTIMATPGTTPTVPVTPTATATPTETPTPQPRLAVVDSPNGLWLRSQPGVDGEQVENLAHLAVLTVLDGLTEVDDLEWQEVLAPSGNRGWVAASFLAYQD
jgi:hypothetical protein